MCKYCPTPDPEPFKPRVREGVKFLNANGPADWRGMLAPARLDLGDGSKCVLAQIYGDYATGRSKLGICELFAETVGYAEPEDDESPTAPSWEARERALTAAWVQVLAEPIDVAA